MEQRQYQALTPKQRLEFEIETLVERKIAYYRHADKFRRNPPSSLFLLVPPQPREFDLDSLMNFIEIRGNKGRNFLTLQGLENKTQVPDGPYIMLDVEDGRVELNPAPFVADAEADISERGRLSYTVWPGIVHAIVFPKIFENCDIMYLVGSRHRFTYENLSNVPFIRLYRDEPQLDSYEYVPNMFSGQCVPSCGSMIV